MNASPYLFAPGTFVAFLLASWKRIVLVGFLGGVAGIGASFLMHKMYRGEAVVVPAPNRDARGALGDTLGGLSGLASLAGVNLMGGNSSRDADLEYLKSRELLRKFIKRHSVLPVIYADRWDARAKKWTGEEPSEDAAVARLQERVVSILPDRRSGSIRVAVTLRDPKLASEWANALVDDANSDLRATAQENARKSIEFLNAELGKTPLVGVEQAIYRLIEGQINSIMVANITTDFAFRVVDPSVPSDPHRYVSPNRILMGMLGGILAGIGVLLFLYVRFNRRQPAV